MQFQYKLQLLNFFVFLTQYKFILVISLLIFSDFPLSHIKYFEILKKMLQIWDKKKIKTNIQILRIKIKISNVKTICKINKQLKYNL